MALDHHFRLVVVGAGKQIKAPRGVPLELRDWALETEVTDLQSFDIGLYPLTDDAWAQGKSALKAMQYMAVGVPFVASPVGALTSIGTPGVTHLLAQTSEQWQAALTALLVNRNQRRKMGLSGRQYVTTHYPLHSATAALAEALYAVAGVGCGRSCSSTL